MQGASRNVQKAAFDRVAQVVERIFYRLRANVGTIGAILSAVKCLYAR